MCEPICINCQTTNICGFVPNSLKAQKQKIDNETITEGKIQNTEIKNAKRPRTSYARI